MVLLWIFSSYNPFRLYQVGETVKLLKCSDDEMVELFSWAKEMLAEISEGGKFSLKKGTTGTPACF